MDGTPADSGLTSFALPPPNAGLDYQLGGAYSPPAGVEIVARDRNEAVAPGLFNICYVNGFQIQPDEESFWLDQHPDLVLRDGQGDPVVDADWQEMLIDVSTPNKRTEVAQIVEGWIQGCASAGFDAVEIDNLDSYSRSRGLLAEDHNVAAMRLFSIAAHSVGLGIAQKNSSELVGRRAELGTDFVVAEECNRYDECDIYRSAYGDAVLVIEYRRADFTRGCQNFPSLSIVLRDRDLTTPSAGAYVYDGC
ncbi:MAG: endo alpha-1,4 polygalactosaminidase [Deltaproteobacteria bacterium]|nr:endo alpha-1,4 polygalactosaminidase [Deltaproteobacteria bacterium]